MHRELHAGFLGGLDDWLGEVEEALPHFRFAHLADLGEGTFVRGTAVVERPEPGAAAPLDGVVTHPVIPVEIGPEAPLHHGHACFCDGLDGSDDVANFLVAAGLAEPCFPVELDRNHHRFEDHPEIVAILLVRPNVVGGPVSFLGGVYVAGPLKDDVLAAQLLEPSQRGGLDVSHIFGDLGIPGCLRRFRG